MSDTSKATIAKPPVIEAVYPLTPSQQGMLLESLAAPGSGVHIEQSVWELTGEVRIESLTEAWEQVIRRHPALRTSFVYRKRREPIQAVVPAGRPAIVVHDWRDRTANRLRAEFDEWLAEDRRKGFNLSRAPLMRFNLFRTADFAWTFVWTSHHILFDGWCAALLSREVLTFYQASCAEQTGQQQSPGDINQTPARPYQDYVTWLGKQNPQEAERWWRHTLSNAPAATWPGRPGTDAERSDDQLPENRAEVGRVHRLMDAADFRGVTDLATRFRLTPGTIIMAAWALQLAKYNDSEDIVFGTTVSGRPPEIPGVESIVGLFTNTVPLRVSLSGGQRVSEWLHKLQTHILERRDFEYCSAGQIHSYADLPANRPLYHSIVVVENFPVSEINEGESATNTGFQVNAARHEGAQTQHPITLLATAQGELELLFVYSRRHFSDVAAARLADHMMQILVAISAGPDSPISELLEVIPTEEIPIVWECSSGSERGAPKDSGSADAMERPTVPRSSIEMQLLRVWRRLLGTDKIGVRDRFFDIGGTSLLAVRLMAGIEEEFKRTLSLAEVFQAPTIESMATLLMEQSSHEAWSPLVPLLPDGGREPLFCVHPLGGNVLCYDSLVRELSEDGPIYGLQAAGFLEGQAPYRTVEEMVDAYLGEIRRVQPTGPCRLTGYSFGGYIAYEIARRMAAAGGKVTSLTLIDTPAYIPDHMKNMNSATLLYSIFGEQLKLSLESLQSRSTDEQLQVVIKEAHAAELFPPGFDLDHARRFYAVCEANHQMEWSPGRYDGPVTLVRARESETGMQNDDESAGWNQLTSDLQIVWTPGRHEDILESPAVGQLADLLRV